MKQYNNNSSRAVAVSRGSRRLRNYNVARPLAVNSRTFRTTKCFKLSSWQDQCGIQYSTDYQFVFKLSDFGTQLTSCAALFDQIRVKRVHWRVTKLSDFASSAGDTAKPRNIILHSTYDPDGGSPSNVLDLLQHHNLKSTDLTLNQPTAVLSGVPAYTNSEGRVVKNALLDIDNTTAKDLTFHSHSVFAMAANMQPGSEISLYCQCDVDIELIGKK